MGELYNLRHDFSDLVQYMVKISNCLVSFKFLRKLGYLVSIMKSPCSSMRSCSLSFPFRFCHVCHITDLKSKVGYGISFLNKSNLISLPSDASINVFPGFHLSETT